MKLETVGAHTLTTDECRKLRSLTLRKDGQLAELLSDWRYDSRARVTRMIDDDGKILAWGMHVPYDSRLNKDLMVYVRKSERRKGYGSAVYNRLVNSVGGRSWCIVHGHDYASVAFFNKIHYAPLSLPALKIPPQFIPAKLTSSHKESH